MKNLDEAIREDERYFSMLALMASLSNLFSDSNIPFIHYRITENLFCKYLGAINLSRTDTAYDAKWKDVGVGIKTFTIPKDSSVEKIAEFNALSPILRNLDQDELAYRLADFRNERMEIANTLYGINNSLYHIIGRKEKSLYVFNTAYDFVDKESIKIEQCNDRSLHFSDGKNKYSFNKSKSVLLKKFELPNDAFKIDVDIINDPFKLLESLLSKGNILEMAKPKEFVLLPLFSEIKGIKYVPEKSGLNQWNALGRKRDENEVYIPIPSSVHRDHPNFFPDRNTIFTLFLPDGSEMKAKVCQAGEKALMSNPNKDLGKWILRKILKIKPGQLVTYDDLAIAGFNSIVVTKGSEGTYHVNVSLEESFKYKQ